MRNGVNGIDFRFLKQLVMLKVYRHRSYKGVLHISRVIDSDVVSI